MKLPCRIISLCLMLIMILAMCAIAPVSTMAAATPVLSVKDKTAKPGEQIEIKVSLSGAQMICGGNLTLKYDSALLSVESYEYGSIVSGATKNCNLDYHSAGNLIRFTFNSADALSADGTLITLTFRAKSEGVAELNVTSCKMYDKNGASLTVTTDSSEVTIRTAEVAKDKVSLTLEDKTVKAGELVTVPVVISKSASVYGGNFTLEYNSNLLNAESYEYGSIVSEATKNCNLDYQSAGNLIRFTFSSGDALSTDGTLITITFRAKSAGTAHLSITSCKMYDKDGGTIDVCDVDGVITVVNPNVSGIKRTLGDPDMDGVVNIKDATVIQKCIANLMNITADSFALADVDGDGSVNIKDATAIQKYIAGIDTGLKIGNAL